MKQIFAVYVTASDTCGNRDRYGPLAYVRADSPEEVLTGLPQHFMFYTFDVQPVNVTPLEIAYFEIEEKIYRGRYR